VPTAFAKAFRKRLFPLVYHRLSRNLPEAGLIPDAASEIFVDFLVRIANDTHTENERSFEGPRHDEFLRVLCDRAVARVTGGPPAECVEPSEDLGQAVKSLKRTGLYDAVLKDVADRMSRLNDSLPAARA
jgi:hypothetical protein